MDLTQLRYFLSASESQNFSQAAARSFTSRQNLTHAIRNLERELGVNLFMLSGNVPKLTVEGERAVEYARQILDGADAMSRAFSPVSAVDDAPSLKLAYEVNLRYSQDAFYDVLASFTAFDLLLDERTAAVCYDMVVDGRVDAALIFCLGREFPLCESALLGQMAPRILVSSRSPLAQERVVRFTDLDGYDLLLIPEFKFVYRRFLEEFKGRGLSARHILSVMDYALMVDRLDKGDVAALVSDFFPQDLPRGVASKPFEDFGCMWGMYLLYRRDSEKKELIQRLLVELEEAARSCLVNAD